MLSLLSRDHKFKEKKKKWSVDEVMQTGREIARVVIKKKWNFIHKFMVENGDAFTLCVVFLWFIYLFQLLLHHIGVGNRTRNKVRVCCFFFVALNFFFLLFVYFCFHCDHHTLLVAVLEFTKFTFFLLFFFSFLFVWCLTLLYSYTYTKCCAIKFYVIGFFRS